MYTIYSNATGRVLRVVLCEESQISEQLRPGENYIEGDYSAHYFENGVPIPIPAKPTVTSIFDYASKTWQETLTVTVQWRNVRQTRAALLLQTDWTQLPDVPLATKENWSIYRQTLRDVTLQADPFNIVWPVPPL